MKYTIEIEGQPLQDSEGRIYKYDDYVFASDNYHMCYNESENILIVAHGDDYDNLPPHFAAFLKAHPKGTKGLSHLGRWLTAKHKEFQETYPKNKPDYSARFLGWLKRGIEAQKELF